MKIFCSIIFFTICLAFIGANCAKSVDNMSSSVPSTPINKEIGIFELGNSTAIDQENKKDSNQSTPSSQLVKEFDILAMRYKFVPSKIEVTKGDKVVLRFKNADVMHGVDIFGLGVNKEDGINAVFPMGKTTTIEFEADTVGEFPFACSVTCGSKHDEMIGTIVIKDK